MRKKSKRILAAVLSAILIWNTCGWQPQALAADSLQRIGAETEADDTAETAEKEAALKKSALKASPSNAEAKDNRGESGTNKAEAESGADADAGKVEAGADADTGKAEAGADADTGKAEAGADAGADKAEAGANGAPNGTATGGAEIKAFLELDEAIAVQKLSLGAKESDIILPDTLDGEVEGADEMLAEDSQNVHLVEAANKGTEKDREAETATWQISGITWKLNEEQSDLPEFHGGISEKDYFEEFDENGEPVETSTKTWAGYAEANQEYNGRVYVYRAVLPEELGKFEVADTADLPEIDVMVRDASVSLLADVLESEQTSIDYQREVLKNMALYDLEYAESKSAASWEKIPADGEASLTEILDKQPESATEITLYVRKAATGSTTESEAVEIKIPVRPAKPAQIQETDITKDSYSIKVKRPIDSRYEYGIAESESGVPEWQSERTFTSPKPAHTYYVTLRVKATDSSFASKPAERLLVTTPDTLLIDGPADKVSFETKGTYGQTLDQILVKLAAGFQVVNYSRLPVSGTWKFSENQSGTPASSIYPEVNGTTAYQVEFIPTETSEGQYGKPLTQSVIPEISPKELTAVLSTPIEKNYDGSTDIALKATVEIGASGQSYTISGLKGSFADANAGTGKAVTIDPSKAVIETEGSAVNLQNYRVVYPAQTTGTIRPIQGSVSIDPKAWTGEKTYGDDIFSLTGVNVAGDGALNYTSSDKKVLTVDAQGQVTIKGTGSAEVSITMEDGTNYIGTSTPAKRTITIEKGTLTLTLTAVNRSTGVQQPEGILGTYEDDFDIIARIQGAYGDKLQGMIRFYDNGMQNPDTIPVGEAGTAVLKLPKPGVASVGTHRMTAEFDFDTHQEWAAKYNTPAPAAFTFTIGKVAAPQITWPTAASVKAGSPLSDSALSGGSTEYGSFAWKNPAQTAQAGTHSYEVVFTPNEGASSRYEIAAMIGTAEVTATEDKPEKPNRNSSSSGQNKTFGSGVIRQDSVKGTIDSTAGIITGETNSFANDGKSHWMLDEHSWWLRFADNTYPKGRVRESGGISHSWELINGNWWAFDETGYAKTGWLRDEDYGGWFYIDLEHGMQTGWVLLNGAWYYFNPVSDGKRGIMYAGQRTPDGYYVEKNGVWDGRNKQ